VTAVAAIAIGVFTSAQSRSADEAFQAILGRARSL
jgi:hypothetical protein